MKKWQVSLVNNTVIKLYTYNNQNFMDSDYPGVINVIRKPLVCKWATLSVRGRSTQDNFID